MTDVVRLDNVTKRFGRQTALRRVSFAVPEGSVFALLGENGAGKTTAIRILLGLADADEGKTEVLGLPSATAGTEIRRRVGYVPEESDLYDWMRVDEIGWFAAGFYSEGYFPRYQGLIDGFHVPRDRKISALSKGMRAKVRLAIALGHDPELLILDEPTSGLDAIVRREFLESMVDRAATGRTVLLSSHQIHEVERVADHVAIIREGELIAVERLDAMKEDTRRLTLTVKDLTTPLPEFAGKVLRMVERGRQIDLVIRGMSDAEVAVLAEHPVVEAVEQHPVSLEEIFVAYMQRNGTGSPAGKRAESVTAPVAEPQGGTP
jgi:ABC-2 type transport system ATP-binding protein